LTLANAQGRVHITLPMPLDTDASKAREIILDVLNAHPSTLAAPAPVVRLDNLDGGTMTFDCTAYVNSPRDVSAVKSDLLFETLDRLRDAKLPMTSPQSMVVRTLPAALMEEETHDDKD
jgi:potassium efflux system protein